MEFMIHYMIGYVIQYLQRTIVDMYHVMTTTVISQMTFHILQGLVNNLIIAGHGREAAFAAAILGDNALMEKAWHDTGMLAEAVLHAHVIYLILHASD